MYKSVKSSTTIIALGAIVTCICPAADSKQQKPNLMKVVYHVKSPIAYHPLTIKQLLKKDYKPTDRVTLPNGQTVTAGDYVKSVNALEAKLNQIGYSVANTGPKKELITDAEVDPELEKAMRTELDSKIEPGTIQGLKHGVTIEHNQPITLNPKDFDTSKMSPAEISALRNSIDVFNSKGYRGELRDGVAVNVGGLRGKNLKAVSGITVHFPTLKFPPPKPLPPAQNIPFHESYTYSWKPSCWLASLDLSFGASYTGNAYITRQKTLDESKSHMSATMNGDFKIGALGMLLNRDLLKFDATFQAKGNINANMYVGGNQIYSKSTKTAPYTSDGKGGQFGDTASVPFDESMPFNFEVAPGIFIMGLMGVNGAVGIEYDGTVTGLGVFAEAGPFIKASVYAQAAIGAGFAVQGVPFGIDAGLKCSVLLFDEQVNLSVNTGLGYKGSLALTEEICVTNKIDAFSGAITGFVNVPYVKEYDFKVFSWKGIHQNSTLYDRKFYTPLGIQL